MKFETRNKVMPAFSFTSLTDVVMNLLIFFLLSSSFVVQPGIKVQVPKASAADASDKKSVTLTLTKRGRVYVNAEETSIQALGQKLSLVLDSQKEKTVIVSADKDVTLQQTVRVIDIAKSVGASKFMIATQPASAK